MKTKHLLLLASSLLLALASSSLSAATVRTWSGASATSGNWTTAANWQGNVAPVAGDVLSFPDTGARRTSNTNNFPAGTAFSTINIFDTGYRLRGNGVTISNCVSAGNPGGTNTVDFNISAAGPGVGLTLRSFASSARLTLNGDINLNGDILASAPFATALGNRAAAAHTNSLVWADGTAVFSSTRNRQVRLLASGGVDVVGGTDVEAFKFSGSRSGGFASPVAYGENSNTAGSSAPTLRLVGKGGNSLDGVLSVSTLGTGYLAAFGNASDFVSRLTTNGTWTALAFTPTSDRNAKDNFKAVDAKAVLEKVAALPLSEWNYKADTASRHIGPVAQDFHAAFGLGADDKHIATVDADGVALAAIQGLNQKLEQKLEQKETEITELKQDLSELKALVQALSHRLNGGSK